MMEFISSWVKGLGLAIVIVSILEMLLPNNKTKKYIRVVMGIYVLFTIISPFLSKKDIFNLNNIDFEEYTTQTSMNLDQSSMDNRIKELYIEELEKDIIKKLKEEGYEITYCKVKAEISDNKEETGIKKIKIQAKKIEKEQDNNETNENNTNIENEIVTQIQKIKPIDTSITENSLERTEKEGEKISKVDIQNIKKFLIKEYEVNEKCLEIN